jgi:Mlc titration factor MtfA (ptsG expression regulator)
MFGLKEWRRRRIAARPFPREWMQFLNELPVYHRLSADDQAELRRHIAIFIAEKNFEGCAGLVVTDRMKVIISAHSCLLLLHRETDYYPNCTTILVYPDEYIAKGRALGPAGVVVETVGVRAGESWHNAFGSQSGGPLVLSWRSVQRGAHCPDDGHNVVFHEFAHQLDGESGAMDGAPLLDRRSNYLAWARVLGEEFSRLHASMRQGLPTLINPYGATNPAEFFAVCTELFFERAAEMKATHPALYEQLQGFYRQDPARWVPVVREQCA